MRAREIIQWTVNKERGQVIECAKHIPQLAAYLQIMRAQMGEGRFVLEKGGHEWYTWKRSNLQ